LLLSEHIIADLILKFQQAFEVTSQLCVLSDEPILFESCAAAKQSRWIE
jgi:hypothetical protein